MDELAKRFADLAEQYGPQVADAAKQAVRVETFSLLVSSLLWFAAAALFVWGGRFLWKRASPDNKNYDPYDASLVRFFGGALIGIGLLLAVPGVWIWIDPWTWIALARPELWLAKKAFHF